jgi:hypothetical protein
VGVEGDLLVEPALDELVDTARNEQRGPLYGFWVGARRECVGCVLDDKVGDHVEDLLAAVGEPGDPVGIASGDFV